MMYGKKKPTAKKATAKKAFKPCAGCPNKTKCKAMGKCMKRGK